MSTESSLVDSALRTWKANLDRASKLFEGLSEEQLAQEIAPGKNRLIYIWGHLTAVNDALIPLLGFGPRLYPELDAIYLQNPDRARKSLSGEELRRIWREINDKLTPAMSRLTPGEWVQRHTAVPEEDFAREPHRNRFTILVGRTGHLAYHLGQAVITKR